jgi:polysaccharide deacetylase family protein (PEP-CTERM system associated)
LLDCFAARGARATFFFLGWIAERLPELVRDVQLAGHEIGSHGYDHKLLDELGRAAFAAELRQTAAILEQTSGGPVRVFRACTWSVTRKTPWAIDELLAQGFTIDSSVFPVRHPDYGVPGAPDTPYRLLGGSGELLELPPLCWSVCGRRLPVGGGGYLRLLPLWFLRAGLRQKQRQSVPGCVYLHPWEVDVGQPRQRLGGLRGFRHYVNLARTLPRLDRLLGEFEFVGVAAALDQFGASWRAKLPAYRASELLS